MLMAGLLLAASVAGLGSLPVSATSLQPQNLAQLVNASQQIVVGTVAEVNDGQHGNLPYVEVNVAVSETLKGEAGETLVFRQLALGKGGAVVDGRRALDLIPGLPAYTAGERVVLFLGPTAASGFRATVGLQQGKFNVFADGIENGMGNVGLFHGMSTPKSVSPDDALSAMLATEQGAVNAGTFVQAVRRAVTENWWPASADRPAGAKRREADGSRAGRVSVDLAGEEGRR